MTASSFSLSIPAGLEVNQFLSFAPLAAIVSNFTPFYIYFPDGLNFVPPWTSGAIITLSHATQARASWLSSPFGAQSLYTVAGVTYTATITYTDDPNLTIAGGTVVSPPADNRSLVFTAAPGATITTGTIAFSAYGCRVDNYTGTWYQIGSTGILVPPFTTGFTVDLIPPVTSLVLAPTTAPYGPANNTTGTQVVLTLYANSIGNSAGTTVVQPTAFGTLVSTASVAAASAAMPNITLTLSPAAVAGQLIIYVVSAASAGGSPAVLTPPAGFTQIFLSGTSVTTAAYVGWKIAAGGETTLTASWNTSGTSWRGAAVAAVYKDLPIGIFQTASASAANTVNATPVTAPNMLFGESAYASVTAAYGTLSSTNQLIVIQSTSTDGTRAAAVAIGSLKYTTVAAETATLTWSGGTALVTAAIAAE